MTFELIDLQELGESALEDFSDSLKTDDPAAKDFAGAAQRLVAKVESTYAVAAKLAHREPTLEGTAAIWSKMIAICDQAAAELKRITGESESEHQSVGRILNLRDAAERRRDLHS